MDTLLLDKDADIRALIQCTPFERIDALPCTTRLEEANLKVLLDTSSVQKFRLKRHICKICSDYDYCILDCPTAIKNISTINGLAFTDDVLVPLTADDYSLQGLADIVAVINDVKEYNDEIDLKGCFITQWENNNCCKAVATQLQDALGNRSYKTYIRTAVKVKEATFTPGSLIDYARNCTAVRDYRTLVKEYLEEE